VRKNRYALCLFFVFVFFVITVVVVNNNYSIALRHCHYNLSVIFAESELELSGYKWQKPFESVFQPSTQNSNLM